MYPGYTVAGKTGTAQIPTTGKDAYTKGAYMASFVGFAPAVNPTLSMIVVLDRPTPIFGGTVAAPVFSQIKCELCAAPLRHSHHAAGRPPAGGGGAVADQLQQSSAGHHVSRYHRPGRWREARSSRAPLAVRANVRTVQMNLLFDDIEVIETAGDPAAGPMSAASPTTADGWSRATCSAACPACSATGTPSPPRRWSEGAVVGLLCEHLIPEASRSAGGADPRCSGDDPPRHGAAWRRPSNGYPARDLLMIGVTGTNGKTTVTQLWADLLRGVRVDRPT